MAYRPLPVPAGGGWHFVDRRLVGSPGLATMTRPGKPSGSGVESFPQPGAAPSPNAGRSRVMRASVARAAPEPPGERKAGRPTPG